ncbi:ribonuclease J [Bacillus sp. HMF5848]|uniref:ribonuclease J n=1 Tax=Bacillus sp. HMF5848 TaxID=2495421 RepID=UPI000F78809D|nr:ribonuclease J [Bacillus sp. HMF5848]RSK27085.1 ribonuclease J [Bacillus sp. HMF5848]
MNTIQTDKIRLIALGGVGEIGKNMYVVEVSDDIFVVDAGLMFPEDEMYGVDNVLPDITYLIENKERVKAVFLTHGHEDHIGALWYILKNISTKVYGTKLTLALVREKLKEHGKAYTADVYEVKEKTKLTFSNVDVTFFRTNHSIPDSVGICFHTSQGIIVHTGDFKFDQTPTGVYNADIGKMAQIGNKKVLCLLSDSTNAEKPGLTPSEEVVRQEISNVIYNAEGRVIVATFASNVNRIQQVFDAAKDNNRKVVVVGSSLKTVTETALKLGYLKIHEEILISATNLNKYNDEQLVFLATGNHGEPIAALEKMARQAHSQVNIKPGDTVMLAATPMPGNELTVSKTIDLLYRAGADVIYRRRPIHVSGHGSQEELKLMLNLMKPKYFIPVHGEYKMQFAHAKLAKAVGVKSDNIFIVEKGDIIEFENGEGKKLSKKVPVGNVMIDGLGIGDVGNIVLRDRRLLSQDGILIVVVTLNKETKQVRSGPEIITRGFVYVRESEDLIDEASAIVKKTLENATKDFVVEWSSLKLNIRDELNQYLYEKTKRRPMILPIIMEA